MTVLIPITNQPNQDFTVNIPKPIGNLILGFFIFWNRIAGYWEATITDKVNNVELINGLPLITGAMPYPNLLQQFEYIGLGNAYIIPVSSKAPDYPGENDWGENFVLLWD